MKVYVAVVQTRSGHTFVLGVFTQEAEARAVIRAAVEADHPGVAVMDDAQGVIVDASAVSEPIPGYVHPMVIDDRTFANSFTQTLLRIQGV